MTVTGVMRRSSRSPADQLDVRRHNLSVVLRRLRTDGPRTRARLAEDTGLNKATVSSLVAELVERGLVREGEAEKGTVGRPGQAVELAGRNVCGIGAEIGIDRIAVVVRNLGGDIVDEVHEPVPTQDLDRALVFDRLGALVSKCVGEVTGDGGTPAGVTVCVPGAVEAGDGVVRVAPNLGWRGVALADELTVRLGQPSYPVRIDNAANLAALAELGARDAVGTTELLLLTGDSGVGGGIVSGGRLLRGAHGFAGEVGHMPLDPEGMPCGCGRRGCWESLVGLPALLRAAADPDDVLHDPALNREERLDEIARRAEAGDERTLRALERVGTWLGIGAAVLVNVLDPQVVVLGGYFGVLGAWLADPTRREVRARTLAPGAADCRIDLSGLGFGAAVRGGAQVALEAVFEDPSVVRRPEASPAGEETQEDSR